jgi:cytochrome c biogenesis protein CcmG/thiol:disulfide interchange protein DsbE
MNRFLPIAIFLALGVLLAVGLKIADQKTEIPSPLIGKMMPDFTLPVLGQPGRTVSRDDLLGRPFLINVWASWCPTCRIEHPYIEELAESGAVNVVGLNYRDDPSDAAAWLQRFGDPYSVIIADIEGDIALDLGVYAAPESFLVNAEGVIVFKQIGALTPEIIEREIVARLKR